MIIKRVILAILLVLAVQSFVFAGANIPGDTRIVLSSDGCEGECPVYNVTILADGKVVYFGAKNVGVFGRQEKQISIDKLKQLLDNFAEMDFASLASRAAELDCNGEAKDVPAMVISLVRNSRTLMMTRDPKCDGNSLYVSFDNLQRKIADAVEVQDWVAR